MNDAGKSVDTPTTRTGFHAARSLMAAAIILSALGSRPAVAESQGGGPLERCRAMPEEAMRQRCFDEAISNPAHRAGPDSPNAGTWRLVRTPNPLGGPEAVSIMQTPDPSRSDIELAGLMLRCAQSGYDVLIVFLKPFSPRIHPKARLTAGGGTAEFEATVLPPGAAISLPREAAALIDRPGQEELALEVHGNDTPIRGVISLAGVRAALALLAASCPSR